MLLLTLKVATAFFFIKKKKSKPYQPFPFDNGEGAPLTPVLSLCGIQSAGLTQLAAGVGYLYRRTPRQTY